MSIVIDSITYDVNLISVNRKADVLYKFAERTEDGVLNSELLGVYYNYELAFGLSSKNVAAYTSLYLKITEPIESHVVTVPGAPAGYETGKFYFSNVRDELARYNKEGVDYFRKLTFSVIALSPARTP